MKKALVLLVPISFGIAVACSPVSGDRDAGPSVSFNNHDAGTHDAGTHDAGPVDSGPENTDTDAGPTQTNLTCGEIINCVQNQCTSTDTACQQTCFNNGTSTAQSLFNAALSCLDSACPSTSGGVCATQTQACSDCYNSAQGSGGACNSQVQACASDGQTASSGGDYGTCQSSTDCPSGVSCLGMQGAPAGQCLPSCTTNSDCPAYTGASAQCVLQASGSSTKYCGLICDTSSTCPTGTTCQSLSGGMLCLP